MAGNFTEPLSLYFTVMLYTSPFEILNLPTAELQQMDRRMLQLKKKQLLAELQLQSSGVITLGNREFTKNDIIQLFEQLEQDDAIAMHAAIAADPALLQFLQTGKINPGQKFNYNPLYQDAAFIEFVSPFYKEAFNRYILKALASSDFARIEGFFGNPVLLNGEDYDACFGKLHAYLNEKLHSIEMLRKGFETDKRTGLGSLHDFYIYDWVNTLNKLPEEFANFRDDYAIDLYNLAVDLWNGRRKDEARAMLYGIQSIESSASTKKLIGDLINKVSAVEETGGGGGGGVSAGRVIWGVIVVILMIVRGASTCNKSSNRYDYSSFLDKNTSYGDYRYRSGFVSFHPSNKRDSVMLDFLNTLYKSISSFTTETPKSITLTQGSNPYKSLFDKPIFKALPVTSGGEIVEVKQPVESKTVEPDEITIVKDSDVNPSIQPGKSSIDINNSTENESIVFFYSQQFVTSVYLKPNSRFTVQLPNNVYYAFCYSGSQFSKNMPIRFPSTTHTRTAKDFASMGRFIEPDMGMLAYLLPKKNIKFTAGSSDTGISSNAIITIDLKAKNHFDMLSGNGVRAERTMLFERTNVVDDN